MYKENDLFTHYETTEAASTRGKLTSRALTHTTAFALFVLPLAALATDNQLSRFGGGVAAVADTSTKVDHVTPARSGLGDSDLDGLQDYADNCVNVANPDQNDADQDGFGNLCDADLDNNGSVNFVDLGMLKAAFLTTDPVADLDGSGSVNFIDLGIMKEAFLQPPGPSGMACAGTAPCPGTFALDWPFPGSDAQDWVINNYVDLDPGVGILDYAGGAKSYNGHTGVDIDVPTFRAMDNDFPVLAAAQGVVIETGDGNPDRNLFCTGNWNYVTIGHANGWVTTYGHLKKSSVAVGVGQVVQAGEMLGVVGSSGCSTAPHLHFEVRDENANVLSPFDMGLWNAPPVYDTPLGLMDATIQDQWLTEIGEIIDPPPDLAIIPAGHLIGIGLSVAGAEVGDTLRWRIANDSNGTVQDFEFVLTANYRHSFWFVTFALSSGMVSGDYFVEIYTNGQLAKSHPFEVGPFPSDWQQVHHGVPVGSFQQTLDDATTAGYRPIWLDGYEVNGSVFMNAVFEKSPSGLWRADFGLDGNEYQAMFNDAIADGYRLVHLDSYLDGGTIHYSPIFQRQFGQWFTAYHAATASAHQQSFSDLTSQGWVATAISSVEYLGVQYYAAVYTSKPVGGWVALSNLSSSNYQTEFNINTNAGRTLRYLNVYTLGGSPRFSAIWSELNPPGWVARHDMTESQYLSEAATWTGADFLTRMVTGYDNGSGSVRFGAYWAQ